MSARALIIALLALAGCAESEGVDPPTIRLEIDAEVDVPAELDTIFVYLTAPNTEGIFCHNRGPFLFFGLAAPDLPIRLDVEEGERYSGELVFLVLGRRDEREVFRIEGASPWPEEGRLVVPVTLSRGCYGRCTAGEHCDAEGDCAADLYPGAFDPDATEDDGLACELQGVDEGG